MANNLLEVVGKAPEVNAGDLRKACKAAPAKKTCKKCGCKKK